MKAAVLPFNAAMGARPALARQLANFVTEKVRIATDQELPTVGYLAQIQENGQTRAAMINLADTLMEDAWLEQFFGQTDLDMVIDGLLREEDGGAFDLVVRFVKRNEIDQAEKLEFKFVVADVFDVLQKLMAALAEHTGHTMPPAPPIKEEFGTENPEAFLSFLEGFDGLAYINQANGMVALEFDPNVAVAALERATELDPEFRGAVDVRLQLLQACIVYQIGKADALEAALQRAVEGLPGDFRPTYALGMLAQVTGDLNKAANLFEKAIQIEPSEPALYNTLGQIQMLLNMPVNAERNFRKAMDMEGDDKPSADMLAGVLQATNRQHEIPALYKAMIDANPQNAQAWVKYAISLAQAGNQEQATRAFEEGLERLEDPIWVKRAYAPVLAAGDEVDRALDFYEDCLDMAPNDVALLLEYAQALAKAGRDFEIPKVLNDVLATNPDPNTVAQTRAWLIELEQPKRVEQITAAQQKFENNDFEGALRDLTPMKSWMDDYWRLWALLAASHNRLRQFAEAEEAAHRLLVMFPGFEPGYGELVTALTGQGKNEDAYNLMRAAIQNMPNSLPIALTFASAAKSAGHEDEARAVARQIREAVPGNQELENILAAIEGPGLVTG